MPRLISVATNVPKSKVFRFENYILEHEHILNVVQHGWSLPTHQTDCAKIISAKFKNLRRIIRSWQTHLSSLKANIANVKLVLSFLTVLEEFRDLTLMEWNFQNLLQDKLISLLHQEKFIGNKEVQLDG